jgi:putative transcriptional regulator
MIKIKLREILWEKDKTLTEVARQTGLSYSNLSLIKRGKHIKVNLEVIDKLCKFFECTLTDLLEFRND